MKKTISIVLLFCFLMIFSSCRLWSKAFAPKYGCKSDGKNVGAEKLLSGEKIPKVKKIKA